MEGGYRSRWHRSDRRRANRLQGKGARVRPCFRRPTRAANLTAPQIPGIAEVAVFSVPDPRWIEAVVAAVVARPGAVVDAEEIIAFCRERLAGYKTPKQVHFVERLPKNASGKILKRELRLTFGQH